MIIAVSIAFTVSVLTQGLISKVPIAFYSFAAAKLGDRDLVFAGKENRKLNATKISATLAEHTAYPPAYRYLTNGIVKRDSLQNVQYF